MVTFDPGETRVCQDFIIIDNLVPEGSEDFTVRIDAVSPTLVDGSSVGSTATVTIIDDGELVD